MIRRALVVLFMSASSIPLAAQVAGVSPKAVVQNESAKERINAEEAPASVFPDGRLSAGVGAIFLPTDKISPGFLLSAMYSRSLLPGLELEAAVQHHSGVSTTRFVSSASSGTAPAADGYSDFYSWNFTSVDATVLFHQRRRGSVLASVQRCKCVSRPTRQMFSRLRGVRVRSFIITRTPLWAVTSRLTI